jgi:hypothetical protein
MTGYQLDLIHSSILSQGFLHPDIRQRYSQSEDKVLGD